MSMVPSRFNVTLDLGARYVVNTRWQTFARGALANSLLAGPPFSAATEQLLAQRRLLVADDIPEHKALLVEYSERKLSYARAGLVVAPTFLCNCACPDCPQTHLQKGEVLDRASVADCVRALGETLVDRRALHAAVMLHGGEPFTAADRSVELIEGARELTGRLGVPLSVGTTTNGTLLTSARGRRLTALIDVFQVSLAESRARHAVERPFANGRSSYDATIAGIAALVEAGKEILVRFNVATPERAAENLAGVMADLLAACGGQPYPKLSFFFGLLVRHCENRSCGAQTSGGYTPSKARAERELARQLGRLETPWGPQRLPEPPILARPMRSDSNIGLCGSARGDAPYVGPTGELFPCPAFTGARGYRLGHVRHPLYTNAGYLRFIELDPFADPECVECAYLPVCMTLCPLPAYSRGRYFKPGCRDEMRDLLTMWLSTHPAVAQLDRAPAPRRRGPRAA
jgi:uncharacterized protein